MPAVEAGQLLAQIRLDSSRGLHLDPQVIAVALPLRELTALFGKAAFQLGDAPAQRLGLGGLRVELALQLGDAAAELLDLPALGRELLFGLLGVDPLLGEAAFGLLDFPFKAQNPVLQRVDLSPERYDLDALAVCRHRAFIEVRGQFGELGLLVGQPALGLAQVIGFFPELVLGGNR